MSTATAKKPKLTKTQIEELRKVIAHLDTLYDMGEDCMLPVEGECEFCRDENDKPVVHDETPTWILDEFGLDLDEPVPDLRYDALKRTLLEAAPNIFKGPTAAKLSKLPKIKLPRPMVSIDKACHEDPAKQEEMLFKWMAECEKDGPAHLKTAKVFDLDEKDLPLFDPQTCEAVPGQTKRWHARKLNGKVVTYPRSHYSMSMKLDGCSVVVAYDHNGELVFAARRPRDGINGDDITKHVPYIKGIPTKLPVKMACEVTGEVVCRRSDFEKVKKHFADIGKKAPANPRNTTAGGLGLMDSKEVATRRLSFIAHGVQNVKNPPYKTEIERAEWVTKTLGIEFVEVQPFNFYYLEGMAAIAEYLDYETDGVVISVDNLEDQESLGRRGDAVTGNPRGKIAWKFPEEFADVVIKDIELATGRTGVIKPVAIFDGVPLAGTTVSRATLHNYGFMKRRQIDVGTTVRIIKSGKIIPKVIGVVAGQKDPAVPKHCPSCKGDTTLTHTPGKGKKEDMWELRCENPDCPAQKVNNLLHFLKTLGILGLGDSTVEKLVASGLVKSRPDFFKMNFDEVEGCGFSHRQALLICANVLKVHDPEHMEDDDILEAIGKVDKVHVPAWQFFAALGIPTAGKSAGKALIGHFQDWTALMVADEDELLEVEGVGDKTAPIVYKYLRKHDKEITLLLSYLELELPKAGKYSGKKFCLSGSMDLGKKELAKLIEEQGGTVTDGVSKDTDWLVAGPGSGSKSEKAQKYGVTIIDEKALLKMLK